MKNLLKIISKKRHNGNKKPKWNMRKLSIGLVSCLLGFSMLINSGANVYAKEVLNENDKANMRDSGKKVEDSTGTKNSKLPKDKKLTIDEKSKDLITGKKEKKLDTDKKEKATITHPYKTNEKTSVNKLVEEKNNKIKTATPTNLKQDYDDITSKEVIVGKAPANSDIKLKNSKGTVLATTKAKTDGTFSITIPNTVKHGDKLTVTATENGKAESDNSKEVIIDKLAPTAPTVEDVYEEDKEITINLPNDVEAGDKIRIWLPDDKYVEVDLTSKMVAAKKAKIGIPQGTALKKDKQITVQLMDKVGNTSDVVAKNIKERKSKKEKTAIPTDVKQDYDDNIGKAVVTGKAPSNSEVKLKDDKGNVIGTAITKPDGIFSIPIPNTVKDRDKVTVTATETGKAESEKSNEVVIDLKDPSDPTIEDVHVGDKEVTVNLPNNLEVGDKVRITFPNGNRVEVDITAEMIAAKKAKVGIPEGITLNKGEQVEAQLMDKAGNTSNVVVTKVKEKEFDKEKIANIEIKTPPTKTKYTEGEKFDPAGMVVILTDENGKKVDVPAEKFAEYGITVPTENLTKDQTKVEVKVKDKKAEQPITVTPKVSKTEMPVINNAKARDKKITGTAEPGATLTVTTPEGVKTVVAGADGKWEITLGTPLAEGNVIKAVAKVNGKGASNEASITVGKAKPIADQVTPAIPKEKTPVENPTNLTKEEKEIVKKKVKEVNKGNFPNGTKVEIGTDGTATITYPDNSQDKIKGSDLVVKKKVKPIADQVTPAVPKEKTPVENPSNLTKEEKETVKKKLEKANKGNFPKGTKIEIGTDGTATITYPDNSQDKINGSDLVVKKKIISNKPTNKKLPKTSITGTSLSGVIIGLAGIGMSILKKKKRED